MEILRVENLNFSYPLRKEQALNDISFNVKEGEFIVVCGESGCGKTTLLKLIKRELAPCGERSGTIYYQGIQQENLDDRTSACKIGFVMQNPENQVVTEKVWHELAFGLENMGLQTETIRRRVGEMASFFGIQNWFRNKTDELSGGQKQILNLASVMVMQPELLILDEPTSQLDPIAASDFINTLYKLNQDMGLTIMMTEHRLEEVFPIADRILVLEKSRVLLFDEPRKVGEKLKNIGNNGVAKGLPSAIRIYQGLQNNSVCPLTVKEGRECLAKNYTNKIRTLKREKRCSPAAEPAIELKNVWFRYLRESPDIIEDLNLTVTKGEIVCLLGGNGSGKTTLLSIIAGSNRPYRGRVKIFGKNIRKYKGRELYVNCLTLLPQNPQTVFIKETVLDDYLELCKVLDCDQKTLDRRIERIAERLSIRDFLNIHPYDLSGGEQQKVAMGKILLLEPRVILMDEPTKGIDAGYKDQMCTLLKELKDDGITIVLVSHDVEFCARVADRCGMFFDRTIISFGEPEEFFCNNNFYTTAANRISRTMFDNAITTEDVIELCRMNGKKSE
jgi:energy-coupling factor transporter ATP-binding protein EcfA2